METKPARSPYNQMIRDAGDAYAAAIIAGGNPSYTSPGGLGVIFLPRHSDLMQVACAVPHDVFRGKSLRDCDAITLAAAKAIKRLSGGAYRARTISLDDRFVAWMKSRQGSGKGIKELVAAYCQETGERIERREDTGVGKREIHTEKSPT